jgi:hypothetical protein
MQLFNTGIIPITAEEALAEATAIYRNALGNAVNTDPSSPTGQEIQEIANAIIAYDANMIKVMYTLNPNVATGFALDSIIANIGSERIPATFSTASCVLNGLSGTIIPAGSLIESTNGDQFQTDVAVTIGISGTITVAVSAVIAGDILVTANTLTTIVTTINGWDTVNNPLLGTIGTKVQNDVQVRNNRIDSLAFSSANSLDSVLAGCATLSGVTSYYVTQNITTNIEIIDGVAINPISILAVLSGGNALEIADMLYKRTSIGTSGNTSQVVNIPNTVQTQTMNWQTAVNYDLKLTIKVQGGASYPLDLTNKIATIMNDQYNFNRIGRQILASEILTLLNNNGITPILEITFDIGAIAIDQTNYTMKISDSLVVPFLASNVTIITV